MPEPCHPFYRGNIYLQETILWGFHPCQENWKRWTKTGPNLVASSLGHLDEAHQALHFGRMTDSVAILWMMNSIPEKNTPTFRKDEIGLKLKFNISTFYFRVLTCPENVASYCKMGR